MKYYVDCNVNLPGDGTRENPFKRIQMAAEIAAAEEEVLAAGTLCYNGYMSEEEWKTHFEGYVGEDIVFDTDYYGKKRGMKPVAGPFA